MIHICICIIMDEYKIMNTLFLFFGISFATPALRQEVQSLIHAGKCKKATQISEVWEKERSKAWKHWSLRVQALECAKAPIDRIYYAYRMYLWYGGNKTDAIKSRMKELYPSLYDLRVTIQPPKNLRNIKMESISLEILERPWAPFNKEKKKTNEFAAINLLPDRNTLAIRSTDPQIPEYSIPIPATANTEYEVIVNWPKATITIPKTDPRISAKITIPGKKEGKVYKVGKKIKTIAGNITVEPILNNLGDIRIPTYKAKISKGSSELPLPWGYEVFLGKKLVDRDVFDGNTDGFIKEDIKVPIAFGIETINLPSKLDLTPEYGQIQTFRIQEGLLPLGEAHNNIAAAQQELKANLKPQLIGYGAAAVLLFTSSALENMAQNSALVARRSEEADEYNSEVLRAKFFRGSSIGSFVGGMLGFGFALNITFGPAKTIIANAPKAQAERKNIKKTVINLNEYKED